MFNARPVVYILYRNPLGDNIYKQWELVRVMVIRLFIYFGEFVKVVLKREVWEKGWVGGRSVMGCWVLWPLCVFGCIFVVVEGVCVRDCRGWGCVQLVG
jgi:hypothetical protein